MSKSQYVVADLLRVMERLRDPERGCPWDLQQTFRTIVSSTLEECYELAETIEHEDYGHLAEELGDVLFQVVFYAQLAKEEHYFEFGQIVDTLVSKLIRRHPHVFADGEIEGIVDSRVNTDQVKDSWEKIKREERKQRSQHTILADIPVALPALPRAQKLQKRAAQVGFDWSELGGVRAKLDEELEELDRALETNDREAAAAELGDVLFSCVNLARHLKMDAEQTLRDASAKFERRFNHLEQLLMTEGKRVEEVDAETLECLWERSKTALS